MVTIKSCLFRNGHLKDATIHHVVTEFTFHSHAKFESNLDKFTSLGSELKSRVRIANYIKATSICINVHVDKFMVELNVMQLHECFNKQWKEGRNWWLLAHEFDFVKALIANSAILLIVEVDPSNHGIRIKARIIKTKIWSLKNFT